MSRLLPHPVQPNTFGGNPLAAKTNILVARVSYFINLDGRRLMVHRGKTTAHANHPIVRGNEDKWRSLTVDYPVDGAPDEKPAAPKKRAATKKQAEPKPEPKPEPKAEPKPGPAKKVEQPALTDPKEDE